MLPRYQMQATAARRVICTRSWQRSAIARHYREIGDQIDSQDDTGVLRIFLEAVAQTYDPHSEYLGPSDLDEFKIDTRLTISGRALLEKGRSRRS